MMREKKIPLWIRLVLICSGTAATVLMMQTDFLYSFLITAVLSLVLWALLCLKTNILEEVYFGKRLWEVLLSAVLSVMTVYQYKSTFFSCCKEWITALVELLHLPEIVIRLVPWGVALLALPAVFGGLLWFWHFMAQQALGFRKKADYVEWLFLVGAGILLGMMVVFTYMCTQAFHGAHVNGSWFNFDLVYSADSGYLVNQDVYRNVGAEQNDLRQPLFGLFALPFAQVAGILASILPFIPEGYVTILQIMEVMLFLVALVLVARMLDLQGAEKALFLVLMTVSYPSLIFALTAEQYLFAVFYLILGLYLSQEKLGGSLCFIGATGSMLTSGVLFPAFTWDRNFKTFVKNTVTLCLCFFTVTILCGRLTTFLDIPSYIEGYGYYAGGDVAPVQKLQQYVNFVGACLAAPDSYMDFTTYNHVSWQMVPVTSWRIFGFVMLALSVLGVVVSCRQRFSRICGGWMAFSFLLLGVVGWGTIDNGLMLYSLYFGWAFIAMSFRFVTWLLHKLLPRFPVVRYGILLGILVPVSMINVMNLRAVLIYATQFYPALR